ncbi:MAG TPA: MFS transporter [Acidimicrobiia bacterium]|nr:MFS transporter [Acidimicrobiia bacterium]
MTSAVEPLRYPHFRWLWVGNVFSASGTFVQSVAASWLMWELTRSSAWVGLIVASATLPLLFFSLAAGALADRFDRAKLMLIAQAVMGGAAAAMAVLTFLDLMTPALLLILGLLLGTGLALNLPAWQALVPDLVPRELVASAVALNSAAFNAARAIGPAFGGALVAIYGAEAGFAFNALSYVAIIVALVVIGPHLMATAKQGPQSMRSAISTGIRFARFTPVFRNLMALVATFALSSAVVQAVLPVHTEYLGGGPVAFGVLYGAMGAGALSGAVFRPRVGSWVEGSWVPYTISLFGGAGLLLGLAPNVWVAGVAMFFAGLFWLLTLATLNATAQLMSPAWIRGRAMSIYTLAFAGVLPIGSIASGLVADRIGTPGSLLAFSGAAVVLGLFAPRFGVPHVDDVVTPEFNESADTPVGHDDGVLEGGPVIILNTWKIDEADFPEFTSLMNEVRLIRLSTGAHRWRLFRNTSDPTRLTELMVVRSWEEHLAQHRRIDDAAAGLIRRARRFDIEDGPRTRHLIAVDVERAPDFEDLVATHEELHQTDGSIPQQDQGV